MKAILIDKPGGPEELKTGEIQKPVPGDYEILVKVHAAALNRADILQREGKYPPPAGASKILGLEISGEIQTTGDKVSRWKKGDKIFGLVPGGGYAEYAIINERMANPIPANFSYEEAAAIPEVFLTAYQALVWHANLQPSEKILIHAGGSGVGTAAIQIARLIGAEIYITASEEKHEICISLGTKKAINYKTEDFSERINEFTEGKGVNVIIDFIAGSYFQKNLKSLSIDGRIVMLATLGGGRDPEADIRQILTKRLTIIGSTLRSRTIDYQVKLNEELINFAFDKFEQGSLKPVIDKIYDWKDAAEAHRRMEANKNTGKIILKISD
jgi:tumor protein p53-inducible protein 3